MKNERSKIKNGTNDENEIEFVIQLELDGHLLMLELCHVSTLLQSTNIDQIHPILLFALIFTSKRLQTLKL